MHHPMLVGLVAYALNTSESIGLGHFQPRMLEVLKDLKIADNFEDLPWYNAVFETWQEKIPGDVFPDMLTEFTQLIDQTTPEQLIQACVAIRTELLVENAQPLNYPIKNVYGTFTVQWEDGLQVEYNCRPFNIKGGAIGIPLIARLSHMFADQFIEASVQPGLDTFHDQVAKPFDQEKFQDLMKILEAHINGLDASEREPYQHIVARFHHQFGPGPQVQMPQEGKPLEFIDDGGGFNT